MKSVISIIVTMLFISMVLLTGACSDFHMAIVSHGSPPPKILPQDTIRIPADSILVTQLFETNDSVYSGNGTLRSGFHAEVHFSINNAAQQTDSILVYGTVLSSDTLNLSLEHSGSVNPIPGVQINNVAGLIEHKLQFEVGSGVNYILRYKPLNELSFDMGIVLLAGYQTPDDSPLGIVDQSDFYYEVKTISRLNNQELGPNSFRYQPVFLAESDSLILKTSAPDDFSAYLLTDPQKDQFLNSGSLADPLEWESNGSATLRLLATEAQRLNYLVENPTASALNYSDSVVVYRRIAN
jgi:hypothetical protein